MIDLIVLLEKVTAKYPPPGETRHGYTLPASVTRSQVKLILNLRLPVALQKLPGECESIFIEEGDLERTADDVLSDIDDLLEDEFLKDA
jgi:hypothetical protein